MPTLFGSLFVAMVQRKCLDKRLFGLSHLKVRCKSLGGKHSHPSSICLSIAFNQLLAEIIELLRRCLIEMAFTECQLRKHFLWHASFFQRQFQEKPFGNRLPNLYTYRMTRFKYADASTNQPNRANLHPRALAAPRRAVQKGSAVRSIAAKSESCFPSTSRGRAQDFQSLPRVEVR